MSTTLVKCVLQTRERGKIVHKLVPQSIIDFRNKLKGNNKLNILLANKLVHTLTIVWEHGTERCCWFCDEQSFIEAEKQTSKQWIGI